MVKLSSVPQFLKYTSICIVGHSQTSPLSQRRLSSRWCHSLCPWGSGLEVPDHCTILRTSLPECLSVFVYLPGPYDKGKYWLKVGETVHEMGGAELQQSPWWRACDGVASKSWFFFFLKQTKLTSKVLLGTCITMEGTLWNRLQSLSCLIFVNLGVPRR